IPSSTLFPYTTLFRSINGIRREGQLLQLGDNFLFAGDDDVFGFEVIVDVDAQGALGQIFDMAEGSLDCVALSQIFFDGLRLGRRSEEHTSELQSLAYL